MPTTLQEAPKTQETGMSRIETIIKRFQELRGARSNFESYWQSLHDYFYVEAPDISKGYAEGSELDASYLWDPTTLEAADVLSSGFMNYLTPPTSKWFGLRTKDPSLTENKAVTDYLELIAEEVYHTLNKSNFYNQVIASYKSSGVYGTSVLIEEVDIEEVARFYSVPIRQVCMVEDGKGRIAEYYIEFEYTTFQAMTRWGAENLAKNLQEEITAQKLDTKHKFILFIAARSRRDIRRFDKTNMPIEALWIDSENKFLIEEGGYNEFPAMCHRFDKRPFIVWGFSPAMKALPFARILNATAKTSLRAMMKRTDPPVALPHNAFIMPFNANPRAVNYYNKKVMDGGGKDIFAFGNYGDPDVGMNAVEYYSQKVKTLMYNDVFLAFDNITKQMNNPEVMERINEKMSMLGPAVGRFTSEVLNPIIIRTIGILFRRGLLPDPPDELMQNPAYEIDYVSQLAQAQRRSQLNALTTALTMTGQMAQMVPDVLDKVDPDKTVNEVWSIVGAPFKILRSDDEVATIRADRTQKQAAAQQMQMAMAGADVVQKGSQVDLNLAKAKQPMK